MTVAELGQRMSSREFTEWMTYYQIEPFGEEIADARNAVNTAATVNATIAAAGGKQRVKADQYRVMPQEKDTPDSAEALYQKFRTNKLFSPRETESNANGNDRKSEHHAHNGGSRQQGA